MSNGSAGKQPNRRLFCIYYLALGNAAEAALRAGFPPETAEAEGLKLLQTPYCRSTLSALAAQPPLPMQSLVIAGLQRLAFGSANDAAKLVFADDLPPKEMLDALDLFHVSELKRVKGGGVEVKLFDRQRAMERLLELSASADSSAAAAALLSALSGEPNPYREEVNHADSGSVFSETADGAELVAPEGDTAF